MTQKSRSPKGPALTKLTLALARSEPADEREAENGAENDDLNVNHIVDESPGIGDQRSDFAGQGSEDVHIFMSLFAFFGGAPATSRETPSLLTASGILFAAKGYALNGHRQAGDYVPYHTLRNCHVVFPTLQKFVVRFAGHALVGTTLPVPHFAENQTCCFPQSGPAL